MPTQIVFNEKGLSLIQQQEVQSTTCYRIGWFRSSVMSSRIQILSLSHGLDAIQGMSFLLQWRAGLLWQYLSLHPDITSFGIRETTSFRWFSVESISILWRPSQQNFLLLGKCHVTYWWMNQPVPTGTNCHDASWTCPNSWSRASFSKAHSSAVDVNTTLGFHWEQDCEMAAGRVTNKADHTLLPLRSTLHVCAKIVFIGLEACRQKSHN